MNTQRILAVLSAALFVGAVGLATVGPEMMSAGKALSWFGPHAVDNIHAWMVRVLGVWSWTYVGHPLLVRPAWLPFASLGLIMAGVAVSVPARDATRRSHRRS